MSISAELFISQLNGSGSSAYIGLKSMPADYSFQHLVDDYQGDYWKTFDDIKPDQSVMLFRKTMCPV